MLARSTPVMLVGTDYSSLTTTALIMCKMRFCVCVLHNSDVAVSAEQPIRLSKPQVSWVWLHVI